MNDSKRLFTAIRFSSDTIKQIEKIQNELKQIDPNARFVTPTSNFHLTLYFIGNVSDIDKVKSAFNKACQKYKNLINEPIKIEFTKLGIFRNRGGNIIWLGAKDNQYVKELVSFIYEELKKLNLNLKPVNFKAHITLARKYKGSIPKNVKLPETVYATEAALVWSHRNEQNILVYDNIIKHNLI